MKRFALLLIALVVGTVSYTQVALRVGSGTPPPMVAAGQQADRVIVDKAARQLTLMRDGAEIASYAVSLGGAPSGHKGREGDERTPEGDYVIDWRNGSSIAHLSLHISYPNTADRAAAKARGEDPGGNIMIHGILNGWGWLGRAHLMWDWTNGCIAVTNAEMREIWAYVPDGTPITILPG